MPANPNASHDATRVLNWLTNLTDRSDTRVCSGQFAGHGEDIDYGWGEWIEGLYDATGKWPALVGADYFKPWGAQIPRQDTEYINGYLTPQWDAGGLVTVMICCTNPWTGNTCYNSDSPLWDPETVDLADLIDPAEAVYSDWMDLLDFMAAGLAELRDDGVVVFWRPFHESTFYDFFWWDWGTGLPYGDRDSFKAVWQHMFDYFSDDKGLDNLLWVYSPADQDPWRDCRTDYAGDGYVDVVGVDIYDDNLSIQGDAYNRLTGLGKPFVFGEAGPSPTLDGTWDNRTYANVISATYPLTTYWQSWADFVGSTYSIVGNQYADELMDHSWVITRDEVDWQADTLTIPPPEMSISFTVPVERVKR